MKAQSIRRVPILVSLLAVAAVAFASAASANPGKAETARYIVVFEDSVKAPASLARTQTENRDAKLGFVYRHALKGYSAELTKAEVEGLRRDPRVKSVSPDGVARIAAQGVPTGIDRVFATVNATLAIDEEDDFRVNADIAVIDTGIAHGHPDLDVVARTNCASGGEQTQECIDNAGADGHGHGTHVAGTAAAIDNGFGVVGVAPGARLHAVKVLSNGGSGYWSWVIAGVDWVTANANEIEVANMSLGGAGAPSALDEAIESSVEAGVVYVVAAGNDNGDAKFSVPANHPDVITVSAIADYDGQPGGEASPLSDQPPFACTSPVTEPWQHNGLDDHLASFSNWGSEIDVAAPGVCIRSTLPGDNYGFMSGTSMASPHVAGGAAILAAKAKPKTKAQVLAIRSAIRNNGDFNWEDTSLDGVHEPSLNVSPGFTWMPRPGAVTQRASLVTDTKATLNATVDPKGLETRYWFEYGETTGYGSKAPASWKTVSGTGLVKVSELIVGLKPGTTYHFRVVAEGQGGWSYGKDRQFETAPAPQTAFFDFAFGETGTGNGQLKFPTGIALDAQGDVWVADSENNRVQQFDSNGEYLSKLGKPGWGNDTLQFPYGIALDAEGDIWVTEPYRVKQFNSGGEYLSDILGVDLPAGVAIDSGGDIWVADAANNRVQQFDSEGEYLSQLGETGTGNGQLKFPIGIALDAQGDIWVVDSKNNRVQQFDSEGEYLSQLGETGTGDGQFDEPTHVAIDSVGDIWVADAANNRVQRFNQSGEYLGQFGEKGSGEGQFQSPGGIALGPNGAIWVADPANDRVQSWANGASFPVVSTEPASAVTAESAVLEATVDPNGHPTDYQFEYGKTTAYGSKAPIAAESVGSGMSAVNVEESLEGLQQGETYHFRVVATNAEGTSYGKDRQFTASANVSLDTEEGTLEAGTPIHAVSEDFTIWVGPNVAMGPYPLTCVSVQVSGKVAPAPGSANGQVIEEAEGSGEDCQFDATKLSMGKLPAKVDPVSLGTIEFDEGGTGSLSSFEGDFDVSTLGLACSWAGETAASTWSQEGGSAFGGGGFDLDEQLSHEGEPLCDEAEVKAEFELFTGEGTPVYVNEEGSSPIATTRAADQITKDSASLNATVNPNGLPTEYRFEWADQEEFEAEEYGHQIPAEDVAIGSANSYVKASQQLEGLQQGETYHFRVVATNAEGTAYGKDRQFTASANVSLDTEEGTLEAGTPIHAISEDFTIWVGPNVSMGPYPLTCDSVQVSGKVAPAPGSANGQVIEEAEGSGEDCQFDATKLSMGKPSAKVDPVSLGTIEFDEGGTGSLSSFEGDFDVSTLGLACSWAGETAASTWSQEGGSAFGGGGFGFVQQLSAEGEGCAGAKAEAEFELFTGEGTPVYVSEEE